MNLLEGLFSHGSRALVLSMRSLRLPILLSAVLGFASACSDGPSTKDLESFERKTKATLESDLGKTVTIDYVKTGKEVDVTVYVKGADAADLEIAKPKIEKTVRDNLSNVKSIDIKVN